MLRLVLISLLLALGAVSARAQSDSLPGRTKAPSKYRQIVQARTELKTAFIHDDPAYASLWMDSLSRLTNEQYLALAWDERWLLYYWLETYGNVLEEVSKFDEQERLLQSEKVQPPDDSLFETIDEALYPRRFDLFEGIRKSFLSQEEKLFANLELEYLLRINTNKEDWNGRIDAFVKKFPESRFNDYLKSLKVNIIKAGKYGFGLDILFCSGNWNGRIEQFINPLYAGDLGLAYWKNRWNIGFQFIIGGPSLSRDIQHGDHTWVKGDPSSFYQLEATLGYDIINKSRIRIFPSIGAGYTSLRAPGEDPDNDYYPPDYYKKFKFSTGHLLAAITTDLKFPVKQNEASGLPPGSYNALRLKVGYRPLFLGRQEPALQGNLFFISVGYCFFAYSQAK